MAIHGFAATGKQKRLEKFEYDPGELTFDEVEIDVEYCGICHSDLSMIDDEWGVSEYPFIPGHEVVGRVAAVGENVSHLKAGQRVGLGWKCRSCMTCDQCLGGHHNRCLQVDTGDTIVGRHGGFANQVRCQSTWAFPIPESVEAKSAGPLFCGGITVFNPIVQNAIRPTGRVAVVGIGGLGHMALMFLNKWGCDVTAFSTSPEKEQEAKSLGAHHFLNSKDDQALASAAGQFDMVLVTVNAPLDWDAYVNTLRPGGKLHIVGAASDVSVTWFPMILGEKSIGGSPTGNPATIHDMLDFCGRHSIAPQIEEYPMSDVNEALDALRNGNPRYRIVLKNDL